MPVATIIAGPNGAGKTTLARRLVPQLGHGVAFLNADEIKRLSDVPISDVEAGRRLIDALKNAVDYYEVHPNKINETANEPRPVRRFNLN